MSYKFFQNLTCEYFPCHPIAEEKRGEFNCLFCFCPLYGMPDCGGSYKPLANGWKDCSACTLPHFDYDGVIAKIRAAHEGSGSQE